MSKTIAIIGGGVMGLSCGAELLSRGYHVCIYDGSKSPYDTASANAAGLLKPFSANFNSRKAKQQRESLRLYPHFLNKFAINADYRSVDYYLQKQQGGNYELYPQVHQLDIHKLLAGLNAYIKSQGGTVMSQLITHLETINADGILVCAGAGSAKLFKTSLFGRWRQGIILSQPQPLLTTAYEDSNGFYVVPKSSTEVFVGAKDTHKAQPSAQVRQMLLNAAIGMLPNLVKSNVIADTLGCVARMPRGDKVHMGQVSYPCKTPVFAAAGFGGVGVCMAPFVAIEMANALMEVLDQPS